MSFRSQDDYVSKYRRVLEYFDAVKIGITAIADRAFEAADLPSLHNMLATVISRAAFAGSMDNDRHCRNMRSNQAHSSQGIGPGDRY